MASNDSPALEDTPSLRIEQDIAHLRDIPKETVLPSIEQEITDLFNIPVSDKDWVCYIVPVDHFVPPSIWAQIKDYRGVHVVGMAGDGRYEIVVTESYVKYLGSQHRALEPMKWEIEARTEQEAQSAQSRFLRAAGQGLLAGHGRGLDRFYRHRTLGGMRVVIEWTIVIRDIVRSDPEIRRRFLLHCVFLGIHLIGNFDSPHALRLIKRTLDKWTEYLWGLRQRRIAWPQSGIALRVGLHEISLLRGLLESVGGEKDPWQCNFDPELTVNDSFAALGNLIDFIGVVGPRPLSSLDMQKMTVALRQCEMWKDESDLLSGQQLLQYIPIGVPGAEHGVLPVTLVHNVEHRQVNEIRLRISLIYEQVPSLSVGTIDKSVLVCCLASQSANDERLRAWLESEEGKCFYQQSLVNIRESRTLELKALVITALLWRSRLLDPQPDGDSVLDNGSYLSDFNELLHAKPVRNPQLVLETMACSIRRVVSEACHSAVLEYLNATAEPQITWSDISVDQYWYHSQDCQHTDALRLAREERQMLLLRRLRYQLIVQDAFGEHTQHSGRILRQRAAGGG